MLKGKCGCGAVTYRLKEAPMYVHCCHCTDCQKQTGTAFALNGIIETENVECDGPTREEQLETASGKGQIITRCTKCGVAVFSNYLAREGKLRHIRIGTLEEPGRCPPDIHIFTSSKMPWVNLSSDVPVYEEYYNISEIWPQPARDRWRAVFGT
ncbi:MAG: GFA family protein [Pseudomonadota bacterium]